MDVCRTWLIIPKNEIDRVFNDSKTAGAEIGMDFLCFEDMYIAASEIIPKKYIIIDFGCAYAPQSYWFKDHAVYIGVDCGIQDDVHFKTKNSTFMHMTIQDFIKNLHYFLIDKSFGLNDIVAICSAVPDKEARDMVCRVFPKHFVWYPGGETDIVFCDYDSTGID